MLAVGAQAEAAPEVLGCTSIVSSVREGARGVVVTGAGSTGSSWNGSRGTTLGEGHGDNTSGPGEVFVCWGGVAKPPGEGAGRLGEFAKIPLGSARRVGPAPKHLASWVTLIFFPS
jgi:hypothetical protein